MYARHRRVPAPRTKAPVMQHKPFVSPTAGWVTATNLATPPKGAAKVMENFYPTTTGALMRGGSVRHGTASATDPLESAFSYTGSAQRLFGAADGGIFDLTAPADPDIAPTADVTGQTSNYYSTLNFQNAGGFYLLAANGDDEIQIYDGSTWVALVTGAGVGELNGVNSDDIIQINGYRNRIWGVEKNTVNAWYWPTDAIAGTVGQVSLAGIFRRGGVLTFTATWSLDAGDGLDDKIAFVSSHGEVAVFQGDPVDPDWALVGRYDAAPPLGKNAFMTVGGDLLLLTTIGLVPLSAIITKDPGALALAAVSRNIQPDWVAEANARSSLPWEIVKWTARNIAYVSCPVTSDEGVTPPICFAVNLETGAWSKVTGWNTRCFVLHDNQVYFGRNDGALMIADQTGYDDGVPIYHQYVGHMDHLGQVGQYKTVRQARAIFRTQADITPRLDVVTNYDDYSPNFPSAGAEPEGLSVWDSALWDDGLWDAGAAYVNYQTGWVSIGRSGFAHAPVLLLTSGSTVSPGAELVMVEVTHEPGEVVV